MTNDSPIARQLPEGLTPGRSTPTFDLATVPRGLSTAHQTTVWAELVVSEGSVRFVEDETSTSFLVRAGQSLPIIPKQIHRVEPSEHARFRIQFYEPQTA